MPVFAIFASGNGSNARNIINHFRDHSYIKPGLIACNKAGAGVLEIARHENLPVLMLEKERFFRGDAYVDELKGYKIEFIVLAGFLWKIPPALVAAYRGRIINIHPALLPSYGGKGMYGRFVHEAVLSAGDKETGITIHYVDEQYDHGKTILQQRCSVDENDSPDSLAHKVHLLEYTYYPQVIESLLS